MRTFTTVTVLLTVVLTAIAFPHSGARAQVPPQPSTGISELIVYPYEGHAGDPIYLSGHNFLPHTHLLIYHACPDWQHSAQLKNEGYQLREPATNAHGDFAGFPLDRLSLNGVEQSGCTFYASYPTTSFFSIEEIPATYLVIRPGDGLSPGATQIRATVTAHPRQVKVGLFEHVIIDRAWGGADAVISVRYPHSKRPTVQTVRLDWKGHAATRLRVPASTFGPAKATVTVHVSLGIGKGFAHTTFNVVH
ncbi:MAG: hypothetical protein PVSMB7_28280 [Chloroflexota bacterium]